MKKTIGPGKPNGAVRCAQHQVVAQFRNSASDLILRDFRLEGSGAYGHNWLTELRIRSTPDASRAQHDTLVKGDSSN